MLNDNFILLTDSYKYSHAPQYPPNTRFVRSYFESREGSQFSYAVFAGLQYIIKRYLTKPITLADIEEAESFIKPHMGSFDHAKWEYISRVHGGLLPLSISAVPEGTVVPTGNVLMKVVNTDPACWWLTNFAETLLVQTWYPTTVATQSRTMKQMLLSALEISGDPAGIDFKLHDFGCRGVSSMETAALGGFAHLINFKGTDTVPALELARKYYRERIAGFSIPASEHSTITSWGEDHEVDAYANMIAQYGDGALYACVSDSWDIYRAVAELWGGALKDQVLAANGTLVVRPDSGEPMQVVPELLHSLWNAFGGTVNERGYRVLNPKVRLIQGDGVDRQSLRDILIMVLAEGYSADNIAFGSGGGLLQKLNRDTMRFAFKCCEVNIDGEWRPVQKRPATDPTKNSKAGNLDLIATPDGYLTVDLRNMEDRRRGYPFVLREVYRDGRLLRDDTLAEIRERAAL